MSVPRRDRIGVADPQRFGGDPRARWLDPGTALREDWGEIEYVPAKQLAGAVDALCEIAAWHEVDVNGEYIKQEPMSGYEASMKARMALNRLGGGRR